MNATKIDKETIVMEAPQENIFKGKLLLNEPMSKHTSWRVGGVADRFYLPADVADLEKFVSQLPANEKIQWIGLGSNLLVRDAGVRGTVIITSGLLKEIAILAPGIVRAEAGVPCAKVAKFCARNSLVGAEFLAGIPGTIGGALAMNAGAFGGETWQYVHAVETLDHHGQRHTRTIDDYTVGYRSVEGPKDEWFIAAHLQLVTGDAAVSQAQIKAYLNQRAESQPTQLPSCGSVFKNPAGDFAARLIETAGLKGKSIGGAVVSDKHANFIVNTGEATATDIEALILHVQQTVARVHGVHLATEVRIMGEAENA